MRTVLKGLISAHLSERLDASSLTLQRQQQQLHIRFCHFDEMSPAIRHFLTTLAAIAVMFLAMSVESAQRGTTNACLKRLLNCS